VTLRTWISCAEIELIQRDNLRNYVTALIEENIGDLDTLSLRIAAGLERIKDRAQVRYQFRRDCLALSAKKNGIALMFDAQRDGWVVTDDFGEVLDQISHASASTPKGGVSLASEMFFTMDPELRDLLNAKT
jgi:hypothetical protein